MPSEITWPLFRGASAAPAMRRDPGRENGVVSRSLLARVGHVASCARVKRASSRRATAPCGLSCIVARRGARVLCATANGPIVAPGAAVPQLGAVLASKEGLMAWLLELVQDTLTPDIIGKITNLVGETPAATESALRRAAPAVLAGVADNASTAEGAEHMRSLVRDGGWGADLLNNLGSRLGDGDATSGLVAAGTNLLASLFGRNADGFVDVISRDVRVRPGSASTILSLAAP